MRTTVTITIEIPDDGEELTIEVSKTMATVKRRAMLISPSLAEAIDAAEAAGVLSSAEASAKRKDATKVAGCDRMVSAMEIARALSNPMQIAIDETAHAIKSRKAELR